MDVHKLRQGTTRSMMTSFLESETVINQQSGDVDFISTSSLLSFVEKFCHKLVKHDLDSDYTSISAELNVKHVKPVAPGQEVNCEVYLKYIENAKLFFEFIFYDKEMDTIALGVHERVIVKTDTYIDYVNNSM